MDDQIDGVVTRLREVLKLVPKPDKLNGHPWVEGLFVKDHVKGNRLLEKRRPGYQLASALATIFLELQPDRPPESQKEKSRLNARWARFGTLGAYFVPLLIDGSSPAPVTVTDIGARLNETIVELVTGKTFDQAEETIRAKYRLLYVSEQASDAPVSRSTLNDWLQQGLTELAGRLLEREEALSLKHEQASPLLATLKPGAPTLQAAEEILSTSATVSITAAAEPQAPTLESAQLAIADEVRQVSENKVTDLQDIPLDHYLMIDWWVRESLQQAAPANDDDRLLEKARRLAEFLAAIQLQIETGPEPTPRLVYRNVQRALRGIGTEPEHDKTGDLLVALLQRTRILVMIDNYWEFANPNLVDYFAARYISEYSQHWVSLKPRHRRLMQWAATCLARRGDDERTRQFVADLGRALGHASELSWLEVADLLVEFSRDQSPAIEVLREQLSQALQRLAAIKSNRLRCSVAEKSSRLGLDVGLASFDEPIEEVIPATDLERSVNAVGLGTLLHMLGVTKFSGPDSKLVEDAEVIHILLSQLQKPGDEFKLLCAAWLRRSSLQTVSLNLDLKALWKSRPASALEAVAKMASNKRMDVHTQTLARSILTKDDFIVRLWGLDQAYQPLVYTLLLALDKRLLVKADNQQWQVVE